MTVRTKITVCVAALLGFILVGVVFMIWKADRALYNHQRSSLAHESMSAYLRVSTLVNRSFNQIGRDLLDGDGGLRIDIAEAEARTLAILEENVGVETLEEEIGLRDHEERSDVARLRELKREIASAFAETRTAERMVLDGEPGAGRALISSTLESRVEGRIAALIEAGVDDEREELQEALDDMEAVNQVARWLTFVVTIAAVLIAGLVIFSLVFRLRDSLVKLELGADRFTDGDLNHQIPISGRDEFATLSRRLNAMARQLRSQRDALEAARAELEFRVDERTRELNEANEELERRDAARRRFFADIGHELRTPITALRGEAEVALRARSDREENYRDALRRIVSASSQLTRFVNDIFLIAREQGGVLDLRTERLDLRRAAEEAVDQMRAIAEEAGATLTLAPQPEPAWIEGDGERVAQLVRILVANAVAHGESGVAVEIALVREGEGWRLTVADDGPGVPADERPWIFDRFFRGSGAGEDLRAASGAGLGLPIARSLAQAHGGRIWIDAERRVGAAFHVAFPAAAAPAEPNLSGGREALRLVQRS